MLPMTHKNQTASNSIRIFLLNFHLYLKHFWIEYKLFFFQHRVSSYTIQLEKLNNILGKFEIKTTYSDCI